MDIELFFTNTFINGKMLLSEAVFGLMEYFGP